MRSTDIKDTLGECFYFARHGETCYNVLGIVTGKRDISLNPAGIEQAVHAAEITRAIGIASCVASPLSRSLVTARLMLARSGITPRPVDGLEERHWGRLEGVYKYDLDKYSFPDYGVELWPDFMRRTIATLAALEHEAPLFVVAHSGTFRVLCDYLQINTVKKPVRNAWPYRFYRRNDSWHVEMIP